jgi:hypothetical protein
MKLEDEIRGREAAGEKIDGSSSADELVLIINAHKYSICDTWYPSNLNSE